MTTTKTLSPFATGVHNLVQGIVPGYTPRSPLGGVVTEATEFITLFAEGVTDEDVLDDAEVLLDLVISMSGARRVDIGYVLGLVAGYVSDQLPDGIGHIGVAMGADRLREVFYKVR